MTDESLGETFKNIASQDYDRFRPIYPISAVGKIFTQFGIKPNAIFADIAAGTGILSIPLMSAGHDVYHVDISTAMNEGAKHKHARYTGLDYVGNLSILEASAQNTNIPDHSVDAVIISNAAHWLIGNQYLESCGELHRITKPDAKIIIAYNAPDYADATAKKVLQEVQSIFPAYRTYTRYAALRDRRKNATAFIDESSLDHYSQPFTWNINKEQFIGFIGTMAYGIKHGIDDERREALGKIFDKYAEDTQCGKLLSLKHKVDMYCGKLLSMDKASEFKRNIDEDERSPRAP
jgi:ubiquinone/menaquinone biosynthesis C-methylase UbiE